MLVRRVPLLADTMRRLLSIIAFVGLIAVLLSPVVWRSWAQTPMQTASAAQWVPFSADIRTTVPDGRQLMAKFYRALDGSRRTESSVLESGNTVVVVDIDNWTRGLHYRGASGKTWTEQPLLLPQGRGPTKFTEQSLRRAVPGPKVGGFDTVEMPVGGNNGRALRAPALNYFPVLVDTPIFKVEFINVRVGQQDPALFELPEGAQVKHLSQPFNARDDFRPPKGK